MARETDTTRLPDASEERVIECPVCSNAMTTMTAEGVTVDVCAGGCGGIWFDWFELARVDEVHESAGEKFLEVERDPKLRLDLSKRIHCPRDGEIMMRHFHSVKRGVLVDECPRCAGFWLDAGELAGIRSEFATEEERKQAAQEYFSELFDPDLAMERAKTMEDLRKVRRIAYAFRFICPSYYIPGEQDWGHSEVAFQHVSSLFSLKADHLESNARFVVSRHLCGSLQRGKSKPGSSLLLGASIHLQEILPVVN
jgi:Zn-finger nucleic acid-binding protein